jgi:outer membrane protein TolC
VFFCTSFGVCESTKKCQSKSRHGPDDFGTPGLVACGSGCLDLQAGTGASHPSNTTRLFDLRGTLSIPIFQGGSVHGDVLQAEARLEKSHERLDNLRAQIDSDMRTALLNRQSSADPVNVARSDIHLSEETLIQSSDRFTAGVTGTVEVVQAQEGMASAHEQFISGLYNYNYAKVSLARAIGLAEQSTKEYLQGK